MPLLAVPAVFRDSGTPARHDSACHFAEEKRVVPPEERREGPGAAGEAQPHPPDEDTPGSGGTDEGGGEGR